jgi:signal transduction histidine kinase
MLRIQPVRNEASRPPPPSPSSRSKPNNFADNRMHAGDIMNAPPILSTAPLERARHLTVLADRERIAHELNDHVIQQIYAVGLDLQGIIAQSRSSEITARLNRSVADLQTVIEEIITTVFELHATGTQQIGSQHH